MVPSGYGRLLSAAFLVCPNGALVMLLMLTFVIARIVRSGRIRRAYVWSGCVTVVSMIAQFPLGRTAIWHQLAQ